MAATPLFRKILIANRGEIAVRIIRTSRDLGIETVAVYSEADANALHVRLADEAVPIGPSPSAESYLVVEKLVNAALRSGAEAIHPGYGFLAENAGFAQACKDREICFIGPPPDAIVLMGNKIESRLAVQSVGVPVVPGSKGSLSTLDEAQNVAAEIGFPLLIKASAGGGGKGMRLVRSKAELASALETASGEARAAFNDPTVYIERYVENPRHIEVQILADHHGNAIHLGERECSIQRRHQKVVEEAPSPSVTPGLRKRLGEAALAVAEAAGYRNAGTVEFLVEGIGDPEDWNFYFLEMNTRLQVEHPVTEMVTGLDLVELQIAVAAGQPLPLTQGQVQLAGAAIECRIYAEDPYNDFLPSPGRITSLQEPAGPGVRNDSGVYQGFSIPLEYDPLISKLVTFGGTREQAIQRMRRALSEYKVGGVKTTIPFFERLLTHPAFLEGHLSTHFISDYNLLQNSAATEEDRIRDIAIAAAFFEHLSQTPATRTKRETSSEWKNSSRRYWQ
ncbi:MAG: acetyl-CoA carboxylase biotin carboxylase subunit [Acidobacteriota bacterium]|nr:MAG: acetyl-CoA carboxylase biotin carboxylase subunit [Acidobacteriota bacterium]